MPPRRESPTRPFTLEANVGVAETILSLGALPFGAIHRGAARPIEWGEIQISLMQQRFEARNGGAVSSASLAKSVARDGRGASAC